MGLMVKVTVPVTGLSFDVAALYDHPKGARQFSYLLFHQYSAYSFLFIIIRSQNYEKKTDIISKERARNA